MRIIPKKILLGLILMAGGTFLISLSGCSGEGVNPNGETCTDGIKNGDETGVDCGGSCEPCEGTWKEVELPIINQLRCINFPTNTTGWTVGPFGKIFKSTDGGYNWTAQTAPVSGHFYHVEFLNEQVGFIGGADGIIKTTNGGTDWKVVYTSTTGSVGAIDFVNSQVGYAAGADETKVFKTTDGGENWTELTVNINDLDPSGWLDIAFFNEQVGYISGSAHSGDAAVVTSDGGQNWAEVKTSRPCPIYSVDAFEDKFIRAGGYYFYSTNNAGSTWSYNLELTTEGKMGPSSFISKDRGWMISESGYVYSTSDGGDTWIKGEQALSAEQYFWMHFNDDNHGWLVGPHGKVLIFDSN